MDRHRDLRKTGQKLLCLSPPSNTSKIKRQQNPIPPKAVNGYLVADLFKSEAEEERNRIKGMTSKELDIIEGETKQKSAEIRGAADAEVIRMTAEAYGKAPEFFEFMQRLEMYKKALQSDTNLVLSTDSEMFGLFKSIKPRPAAEPVETSETVQ